MCGRFALYQPPTVVQHYLQDWEMPFDEAPDDGDVRQTYNFAPGNFGLIYRADVPDYGAGPSRGAQDSSEGADTAQSATEVAGEPKETHYKLQAMKWGLVPFWTKKNPDYGTIMRTINCRDDSLSQNGGMWASMKKRKRCIVICHGFYEWLQKNNGKTKIPHYIKRKDGKLLLFAGLWDVVQYDDSEDRSYTFTIITTDANKQMRPIHDRMPVILEPGSKELFAWLDPNRYEWSDELQSILKPWDGELEMYPVDQAVGKVGNNSSSFIVPINSTENKKNIVNFFNKQAEKAKSPKKPMIKDVEAEENVESDLKSPPSSTAEDKIGRKRGHDKISDDEDSETNHKLAKTSDGDLSTSSVKKTIADYTSSPVKTPKRMHSATSNGTAPKNSGVSPKKVDKSDKITNFFVKNSA